MVGDPFITVAEVAEALAGDHPPRVLDARWYLDGRDGRADFAAGHVPGAHWGDLATELAGPPGAGGRHPLPDAAVFTQAMRRVGLQPGEWVVAMDDGSQMGAARLWWLLTDAGVKTRVLDGGLNAWRAAGKPVSQEEPVPVPSQISLSSGALPRIDASGVMARLAADDPRLWDVRAPERYAGISEPVDPVAGHIPGAINLPSAQAFQGGLVRPSAELRELFAEVQPDDVVYCGSGVTATQTLLALAAAGIDGVQLYPGSWSDWITDRHRPVAVGNAER